MGYLHGKRCLAGIDRLPVGTIIDPLGVQTGQTGNGRSNWCSKPFLHRVLFTNHVKAIREAATRFSSLRKA